MSTQEICFLSAVELAQAIRSRKLSAVEVVRAHLAQIERANPKVNAIVTLTAEQALKEAQTADDQLKRGDAVGPLHGLPVGYKDLTETKGIRTTFGSPIFKDNVPTHDALVVERMKRAGAITVGKTNTPEFGAGSQTFNKVFGETANPYDLSKTCGGSSGGAGVALACGMVPMAQVVIRERSGARAAMARKPSCTAASPVPSATSRKGRLSRSHQAPATMSNPF